MTIRQTIVIWDQMGEAEIKFIVVPYDASHLNNKYINSTATADGEADELNEIQTEGEVYTEFPLEHAQQPDTAVIVAGFVP